MSKRIIFISLTLLVVVTASVFVFGKINFVSNFLSAPLPSAVPYVGVSNAPTPETKPVVSPIVSTKEVNLDIPFTSQAPHLNWEQPYQDFCEEASVLMAVQYVRGDLIPDVDFAD